MTEKTAWAVSTDLTEANINTYMRHTGGAWNAETTNIQLFQNGNNLTLSIQQATQYRAGRLIVGAYRLYVNSYAPSAGILMFRLPIPRVSGLPSNMPIGRGLFLYSSTNTVYPFVLTTLSGYTDYCHLRGIGPTGGTGARLGLSPSDFTSTLNVNDLFSFHFCYEAGAS